MGKRPMLSQLTASSDWCHVLTLRFVAAVAAISYSSASIILPELVRKSGYLWKNATDITLEACPADAEGNVRSDAEEGPSELLHCSAL